MFGALRQEMCHLSADVHIAHFSDRCEVAQFESVCKAIEKRFPIIRPPAGSHSVPPATTELICRLAPDMSSIRGRRKFMVVR